MFGELLPEDAQYLVARLVAIGIVDRFESVDVPGKDAHGATEALPAPELLLDAVIVSGAIGDAGERIDHGEPLLFLQAHVQHVTFALQLADARAHARDTLAIGLDARFLAAA